MLIYFLNYYIWSRQSVTSRLETSRYRDFSQFLRVSVSVSKILVSKKSLGIGLKNIWSQKSLRLGLKNFGLKKKSRYRSRKYLV